MRAAFVASFTLLSMTAVAAVACGGDAFAPTSSGSAGRAGNGAGASPNAGGNGAGGGAAAGASNGGGGASAAGAAGNSSGGAGGAAGAKACNTGADCGKADPCKGVPYCSDHTCFLDTSGVPSIEDGNKCTKDACSPVTGLPTHTPVPVGDGNPCTKDTCDPVAGPAHVVDPACTGCKADAECDDGDPCTEDTCTNTKCASKPKAVGSECGVGDACTGGSVCDAKGACNATAPKLVDDDDECTVDSCDPQTGAVKHVARPVDDGNACTKDACDPQKGVSHDQLAIDDQDLCTKDSCDPKTGVAHTKIDPGDGDLCTVDSCDPKTGPKHVVDPACDGKCKSDAQCADTNPCTKDLCTEGVCSNPSNEGAACDDGLFCTTGDTCVASACKGGGPTPASDNNPCTVDTCDEEKNKIVNTPVDVHVGGTACTQDSCDAAGTVIHTEIAGCCLDDNYCEKTLPSSEVGVCRQAGGKCLADHSCQKRPETTIDDGNACTKDECKVGTGEVSHTVVVKASNCCAADTDCPGGNVGGRCLAPGMCNQTTHVCAPGADGGAIDDGNPCTTDTCSTSGVVLHTTNPGAGNGCCTSSFDCKKGGDNGLTCVLDEKCVDGKCVPQGDGQVRPGSDVECTRYVCDPSDGHWATCCGTGGKCFECPIGEEAICGGIKQ